MLRSNIFHFIPINHDHLSCPLIYMHSVGLLQAEASSGSQVLESISTCRRYLALGRLRWAALGGCIYQASQCRGTALGSPLHHLKARLNSPPIHIQFSAVSLTVLLQRNSQTKKTWKIKWMWKLNFRAFVQKPSTQRAVLDFSAGNFSDWRGCTSGQAHTSPKKVTAEPFPAGAKVDFLQRGDAECEAPTSSLLFQSCTYKLPEVVGSRVHVVGRYFSFQGKSFVRSELWGYDQILNWGNQREKVQRWALGYCRNQW